MDATPLYPGLTPAQLLTLQKPAQYLGGEHNSIDKSADNSVEVHLALCFPDTYEVGMSHIGLQILYELVNNLPWCWAQRAFMPLADMEELLRKSGSRLCSLEGKRPLSQFDLVGFSLQYELCATNILAMLELAKIPLLASERGENDPIIIGGGPYSYHPEPLADFFDLFFIGDAEQGLLELLDAVRAWKAAGQDNSSGRPSRAEFLKSLSQIEGVYLPSLFSMEFDETGRVAKITALSPEKPIVVRRLLPTMAGAPYAKKPIVPNISTVHNRLSLEVMRGCVRGCRFCQAGYLYRPQRERSPQEILEMVESILPETGFEELSLLSLSTADYCSIVPLLKQLMDRFSENDRLSISFPSTRVDALKPEVLEQVQRVRRTGFTVAPEAGTQRLRDVINKGVTDEQILETCGNVFRMGWQGIKLYFMLGLPTETDDDLRGIIEIAQRIKALPEARGKDLTVSVSSHVPKPHTPFQWAEQISAAEIVRRQQLLAAGCRKAKVTFRCHDPFSSFLEGVFARGDRSLGKVILRAYELGCRLDGWVEQLSEELWMQAFADSNVTPEFFLRERAPEEPLPWDHISCGISKDYFLKEYRRALRDRSTPDCLTTSCSICGACDYDTKRNVLWPREDTERLFAQPSATQPSSTSAAPTSTATPTADTEPERPVSRIRVRFAKRGAFRFVGHLELSTTFQRAARRAGLPLAYSLGFHPMPRIAFGPPTQLGVESREEIADLFLTRHLEPQLVLDFFNQALPKDLCLHSAEQIPLSAPSIQESIRSQRYQLRWLSPPGAPLSTLVAAADGGDTHTVSDALLSLSVTRSSEARGRNRSKRSEFLLRDFVRDLSPLANGNGGASDFMWGVTFSLITQPGVAAPRPSEISAVISGLGIGECLIEKLSVELQSTDRLSAASVHPLTDSIENQAAA